MVQMRALLAEIVERHAMFDQEYGCMCDGSMSTIHALEDFKVDANHGVDCLHLRAKALVKLAMNGVTNAGVSLSPGRLDKR